MKPYLTTQELAHGIGIKPGSIRKRYNETGAYYCLRPIKLPNRRLLWPVDAITQLAMVK